MEKVIPKFKTKVLQNLYIFEFPRKNLTVVNYCNTLKFEGTGTLIFQGT